MRIKKDQVLIMAGDSVTDCGRAQPSGEGLSISGAWGNGYVDLVRGYLTAFHPEKKIRVINKGTSGNQSIDLLKRYDEDVISYKPDWVSILIGINDVWRVFDSPYLYETHGTIEIYRNNLEEMIVKTLAVTKNIILLSPYMIESNLLDDMRQMMDQLVRINEELAQKYGIIFVDLQVAFDKILKEMHPMAICWDRIHPNMIGHTLIAHSFLKAIEA